MEGETRGAGARSPGRTSARIAGSTQCGPRTSLGHLGTSAGSTGCGSGIWRSLPPRQSREHYGRLGQAPGPRYKYRETIVRARAWRPGHLGEFRVPGARAPRARPRRLGMECRNRHGMPRKILNPPCTRAIVMLNHSDYETKKFTGPTPILRMSRILGRACGKLPTNLRQVSGKCAANLRQNW